MNFSIDNYLKIQFEVDFTFNGGKQGYEITPNYIILKIRRLWIIFLILLKVKKFKQLPP
jgi:hypothetical protein